MGRYGEIWGDMEAGWWTDRQPLSPSSSFLLINDEPLAACASDTSEEIWGDMGRYGENWRPPARRKSKPPERYGEIWGDLEAACASKVETSEETMSSCTVWSRRRSKQRVITSLTDPSSMNYVLAWSTRRNK